MADFGDLGQAVSEWQLSAALAKHHKKNQIKSVAEYCVICDEPIPPIRQRATGGTDKCVDCAVRIEKYGIKIKEA